MPWPFLEVVGPCMSIRKCFVLKTPVVVVLGMSVSFEAGMALMKSVRASLASPMIKIGLGLSVRFLVYGDGLSIEEVNHGKNGE